MRIPDELYPLFDAGVVQEVVRPLMAGKEAAAWIVESEGELRCAKVYKQANQRSFQNRADYTEGRRTRNTRDQRARSKKTRYGRTQEESAWQNTEVDALHKLAVAGVRVPKPHLFMDGVLLMELVTDHLGNPAPRLIDVGLNSAQARAMMHFLAQQSVSMLLAGVVHGDLSEYNVLIAADGPVIIDFPQALDAAANRNAQRVFERDLDHLAQFLARFAPDLAQSRYGREIWKLFENGKLHADVELTGKVAERPGRRIDGRQLQREIAMVDAADREDGGGGEPQKRRRKRKRRGGGGGGAELVVEQRGAPDRGGSDRGGSDRGGSDRRSSDRGDRWGSDRGDRGDGGRGGGGRGGGGRGGGGRGGGGRGGRGRGGGGRGDGGRGGGGRRRGGGGRGGGSRGGGGRGGGGRGGQGGGSGSR